MRKYFSLFFAVLLLAACKPAPVTYEALMTHPDLLSKALTRCQMDNYTGANCAIIRRAGTDFSALSNERVANPIEFGKKVMTAESHAADLKEEYRAIPAANTKKAYEDAQFQVECMLAVLKSMFEDLH